MKLSKKSNYYFLAASLISILIGALALYFLIKFHVEKRIKFDLISHKNYIISGIKNGSSPYELRGKNDHAITINPIDTLTLEKLELKDTFLFNNESKKIEPFKQITFYAKIYEQDHEIVIRKSKINSDLLIEDIGISLLIMGIVLFILMQVINRFLINKLWQPFQKILIQIEAYKTNVVSRIKLEECGIDEFDELNRTIVDMSEQITKQYSVLQLATENTSHETQTPLAIISNNTESLLQSKTLDKKEIASIKDIYKATLRLSKINRSLVLLSRIENWTAKEKDNKIDLTSLIKDKLIDLEEIISEREIKVSSHLDKIVQPNLPSELGEVLIANLIKNAIKHNVQGGYVSIDLTPKSLTISNSGEAITEGKDPSDYFIRFVKGKESKSLGMGLAIVKQICDSFKFKLSYSAKENDHRIKILFN